MTYWVPAYVDLGRHPKTRRLARALGCPLPNTVGHLLYLWWWAMEYAPKGDIGDFRDQDIADAAEWCGDAGAFRSALTEAGFLDTGGHLHHWEDYGGKVIARHEANAQRMRDARARHPAQRAAHVQRTDSERAAHVHPLEIEVEKELEPEPTVQGARARDAADAAAPPKPPVPLKPSAPPKKAAAEQPTPEGFALLADICEVTNAAPRGDQRRRDALHADELLRRCGGDATEAVAYVQFRLNRGDSPQLQFAAKDYAPGWRKKAEPARVGNGRARVSTADEWAAYALRLEAEERQA